MTASFLQISAGTGPVEVRAFVARLAPELAALCAARALPVDAIAFEGEPPRSARLFLSDAPEGRLADLLGTHSLVCRSERRGRSARKRWFVDVRLVHLPASQDPLRLEDVEIMAFARSAGPGGQHVNKTASAVRVRHRPSGLTVVAADQRSQHSNLRLALARLADALTGRAEAAALQQRAEARQSHHQLVRGAAACSWTLDHSDRLVRSEPCVPISTK